MNTLLQQAPALIGVIIGAVASYFASSVHDRRTWRRTRTERWDTRRAEAYASYAQALKDKVYLVIRLAATQGISNRFKYAPAPAEDISERIAEAEFERGARWEMVLLLANRSVIEAARDCNNIVWEMEKAVRHDITQERWDDLIHRLHPARTAFYAAARRDLEVNGGDIAEESSWTW